jgi:hypothetical protein
MTQTQQLLELSTTELECTSVQSQPAFLMEREGKWVVSGARHHPSGFEYGQLGLSTYPCNKANMAVLTHTLDPSRDLMSRHTTVHSKLADYAKNIPNISEGVLQPIRVLTDVPPVTKRVVATTKPTTTVDSMQQPVFSQAIWNHHVPLMDIRSRMTRGDISFINGMNVDSELNFVWTQFRVDTIRRVRYRTRIFKSVEQQVCNMKRSCHQELFCSLLVEEAIRVAKRYRDRKEAKGLQKPEGDFLIKAMPLKKENHGCKPVQGLQQGTKGSTSFVGSGSSWGIGTSRVASANTLRTYSENEGIRNWQCDVAGAIGGTVSPISHYAPSYATSLTAYEDVSDHSDTELTSVSNKACANDGHDSPIKVDLTVQIPSNMIDDDHALALVQVVSPDFDLSNVPESWDIYDINLAEDPPDDGKDDDDYSSGDDQEEIYDEPGKGSNYSSDDQENVYDEPDEGSHISEGPDEGYDSHPESMLYSEDEE